MGMRVEVTLSEVTVDQLHHDVERLREAGLGGQMIEWRTSRSHMGTVITMSLIDPPDPLRPMSAGPPFKAPPNVTLTKGKAESP